jgi:flavin reductase (DIM6/NTAB) family NADH-FMN oxidoreductase RutF
LAIDRSEIHKALGSFATGVTVITTRVGGRFYGLTANSFTSVSLAPPVLLFCIGRSRHSYGAFAVTCTFTVNVLNSMQSDLSDRFATSGDDKWRELLYVEDDLGNAMFPDSVAVFSCAKRQTIESGDHLIVLGEVLGFRQNAVLDPLVYCRGQYCVPAAMPPASPNQLRMSAVY